MQENYEQEQTYFNWGRSSVKVLKTSSICFASSLVGVMIIAPTWQNHIHLTINFGSVNISHFKDS